MGEIYWTPSTVGCATVAATPGAVWSPWHEILHIVSESSQPEHVNSLDVVDETFLAVPPATLAAAFADRRSWARYWPDLVLEPYSDRGEQGLRWTVRGALLGTMEVWLEPVLDGTLLHYFLRATPADAAGSPRAVSARALGKEFDRRARAAKQVALELKETLEDGREPGIPPPHVDQGPG